MWRLVLFIALFFSIGLNIFLFLQLNIQAIDNSLLTTEKNEQPLNKKTSSLSTNIAKIEKNAVPNEQLQTITEKIKQAINTKDYFLASFLLSDFKQNIPEKKQNNLLEEIKAFWFANAQVLLDNKHYSDLENSIIAYLEYENDDLDFLFLQIDLYHQQGQLLLAINHYYNIQYHVFTEEKKRDIIIDARKVIKQEIDRLLNLNLWLELIAFSEQVSTLDSEYFYIQLALGKAKYHLGEFEAAKISLQPLLFMPNARIDAQSLLDKIHKALHQPEGIELSKKGQHFIVQALINNDVNVSLMIDTGASISLLSQAAFEQLNQYSNIQYVKDIQLNTAGGTVTTPMYKVAEFELRGYKLKNFVFAVSTYMSNDNDGLLGMNYLSAFDFHIDQENNLLMLEYKK